MPLTDDTTLLLHKAFGDLNTRPFAWCFDPFDGADDHVNDSNTMIAADDDETPQPDAAPPVTDQEPQEGVTYTMDGDAFLLMLRQHLGMPDDA